MVVPKKGTSISTKQIRNNIGKRKGYWIQLTLHSLLDVFFTNLNVTMATEDKCRNPQPYISSFSYNFLLRRQCPTISLQPFQQTRNYRPVISYQPRVILVSHDRRSLTLFLYAVSFGLNDTNLFFFSQCFTITFRRGRFRHHCDSQLQPSQFYCTQLSW